AINVENLWRLRWNLPRFRLVLLRDPGVAGSLQSVHSNEGIPDRASLHSRRYDSPANLFRHDQARPERASGLCQSRTLSAILRPGNLDRSATNRPRPQIPSALVVAGPFPIF